jgi:hypothetical protein
MKRTRVRPAVRAARFQEVLGRVRRHGPVLLNVPRAGRYFVQMTSSISRARSANRPGAAVRPQLNKVLNRRLDLLIG